MVLAEDLQILTGAIEGRLGGRELGERVAMGAASFAQVDAQGRGPGHHLRDPVEVGGGSDLRRVEVRGVGTTRTGEDRVQGRGDGGGPIEQPLRPVR